MKRKNAHEENLHKPRAEIWERCSILMKDELESRPDYDSNKLDNPIKLLETIKEHSLSYEESQHDMNIAARALRNCVNCKQEENENLISHTKSSK